MHAVLVQSVVAAIAANTATGAKSITYPVTLSITSASPSIPCARKWPFSPSAASATPKKIENTTICRISLLAIASTALLGTRWVTNSLSESEAAFSPVPAPTSGSGRFRLWPGCIRLTRISPSISEQNEAPTNQSSALPPTRPTAAVSPR